MNEQDAAAKKKTLRAPVNLRRMFPLALRSIVKKSFPSLLLVAVVSIVGQSLYSMTPVQGTMTTDVFQLAIVWVWLTCAAAAAAKFVYEIAVFATYHYGVELDNVVVVKGLLFRSRVSIPMTKMIDVTIERTPIDLLFFLHNLNLRTASDLTDSGNINGLSWRNALGLQNYLLALLNTIEPPINHAAAQEALSAAAAEYEGLDGPIPPPPPEVRVETSESPPAVRRPAENHRQEQGRAQRPTAEKSAETKAASPQDNRTRQKAETLEKHLEQAEQTLEATQQVVAEIKEQLEEIQK
jgi:membrane protein YdbS with pleckstrin-like domain